MMEDWKGLGTELGMQAEKALRVTGFQSYIPAHSVWIYAGYRLVSIPMRSGHWKSVVLTWVCGSCLDTLVMFLALPKLDCARLPGKGVASLEIQPVQLLGHYKHSNCSDPCFFLNIIIFFSSSSAQFCFFWVRFLKYLMLLLFLEILSLFAFSYLGLGVLSVTVVQLFCSQANK